MTQIPLKNEFDVNVLNELNTIKAFNEILQKEQRALIMGNIEDLDFLASEKERVVGLLTSLDEQRKQYLVSCGLVADADGMKKLFSNDSYSESNKRWNELLELVAATNQLNETNGTLITTRLQHTQRSLAALQCAAGNISLYDPKGQAFGISDNVSSRP